MLPGERSAWGYRISLTFLLLAILVLVLLAIPVTSYSWMQPAWVGRLAGLLELFQFNNGSWLAGVALVGVAAYLSLLVYAIARKDASLGWSLLLALAFLGAMRWAFWATPCGTGRSTPKNRWCCGGWELLP